jgi:integrase/recombinase XerD
MDIPDPTSYDLLMAPASPHANHVLDLPRALRPAERDKLRAHLEGQLAVAKSKGRWRAYRDAAFCLVLLASGIRVSAACALRRSDVRVGRGERELCVRRAKGGKPRRVRLPDDLREVLRGYLDAFPADGPEAPLFAGTLASPEAMSRTTGWRRWKKVLEAVGLDLPGRGCHAARHGLGLALYRKTGDLRVVAAQLGHSDLRSTMIYTAPLPEDVDKALDSVW